MIRWILLLSFTLTTLLSATDIPPPQLSVRGHAVLSKPADQLHINMGVVSQEKSAKAALDENSSQMRQLIASLKKSGLKESEYQTGRFSINPIYSRRPNNADQEWSPVITGFEVRNSLAIVTDKIDQAGSIIDSAAKAGANSIDSIQFQISDPQAHRSDLINAATKNALEDAKSLSEAANVKLVRITSIAVDDAQAPPRQPYLMKSMVAESAPIVAGDVEMSASVSVVFQID